MNTLDPLQFMATLGITAGVAGVLLLLLAPKSEPRLWRVGIGCFVAGMCYIVWSFLSETPDILESARNHIALTLIGLVVASISVIRLLKR